MPKIALISDVRPDTAGAGSLLLYRLLHGYSPDDLRVICGLSSGSELADTLPGIDYRPLGWRLPRVFRNRFNHFYPLCLGIRAKCGRDEALRLLTGFRPDAIVSVANGHLWLTADRVAATLNVPLYLFLHEDWPALVTLGKGGRQAVLVRAAARRMASPVFKRASRLLSVSPGMAARVQAEYGRSTEVFYPSRGADSPMPVLRLRRERSGPPVLAHCGFIHLPGNAWLLRETAAVVGRRGGHLDLYTNRTEAELAQKGLTAPTARLVPFMPASRMADRLGRTADALVVTASFDTVDKVHESTLFPSKMADYTAVGLPIIIWGPEYSSVVQWARQNAGAASVITDANAAALERVVDQILTDRLHAEELAVGALEAGHRYFDGEVARTQFLRVLTGRATSYDQP